MKKVHLGAIVAAVAIAGISVIGASESAQAVRSDCVGTSHFCAWSGTDYGNIILNSGTTANTTVDVADNTVASVSNEQSRKWCAVNGLAFGNEIVFTFAANSNYSTLGSANNVTDWFWAGTAGGCS